MIELLLPMCISLVCLDWWEQTKYINYNEKEDMRILDIDKETDVISFDE